MPPAIPEYPAGMPRSSNRDRYLSVQVYRYILNNYQTRSAEDRLSAEVQRRKVLDILDSMTEQGIEDLQDVRGHYEQILSRDTLLPLSLLMRNDDVHKEIVELLKEWRLERGRERSRGHSRMFHTFLAEIAGQVRTVDECTQSRHRPLHCEKAITRALLDYGVLISDCEPQALDPLGLQEFIDKVPADEKAQIVRLINTLFAFVHTACDPLISEREIADLDQRHKRERETIANQLHNAVNDLKAAGYLNPLEVAARIESLENCITGSALGLFSKSPWNLGDLETQQRYWQSAQRARNLAEQSLMDNAELLTRARQAISRIAQLCTIEKRQRDEVASLHQRCRDFAMAIDAARPIPLRPEVVSETGASSQEPGLDQELPPVRKTKPI